MDFKPDNFFVSLLNVQSRGRRGGPKLWTMSEVFPFFNIPRVAGAVLQTAL